MQTGLANYRVLDALELARQIQYGPLPKESDPLPWAEDAIAILQQERRTCGFNWLTGATAVAVLEAFVLGRKATAESTNPYPEGSDENRAWREGCALSILRP